MAEGYRDFTLILGAQGYGKSVWTKSYAANKPRLLLYDPKAEYPNVDYLSDPAQWVPEVVNGERELFRFGTFNADDVEMIGSTAYAAANCTFIMEECAMIFDRGENVAPWARPIIYMGREVGIDLILVAQRANSIPIGIRSQANRIVAFLQTEPDDVKALCGRIGKQYAEEILTLPELTCLDWRAGQGVQRYAIHP
jgi:hypothetical protein